MIAFRVYQRYHLSVRAEQLYHEVYFITLLDLYPSIYLDQHYVFHKMDCLIYDIPWKVTYFSLHWCLVGMNVSLNSLLKGGSISLSSRNWSHESDDWNGLRCNFIITKYYSKPSVLFLFRCMESFTVCKKARYLKSLPSFHRNLSLGSCWISHTGFFVIFSVGSCLWHFTEIILVEFMSRKEVLSI